KRTALYVLPFLRDLERGFCARIENAAKSVSAKLDGIGRRRRRQNKVGHERVGWRHKYCRSEIPSLAVVSPAISDPRHNREPSKIRVWISQLMKSVETVGAIILYARVLGEL